MTLWLCTRCAGDPTIPACILDLNEIAAGNLAEIRDGDAGKMVENR